MDALESLLSLGFLDSAVLEESPRIGLMAEAGPIFLGGGAKVVSISISVFVRVDLLLSRNRSAKASCSSRS